jgi:hypothetical protein
MNLWHERDRETRSLKGHGMEERDECLYCTTCEDYVSFKDKFNVKQHLLGQRGSKQNGLLQDAPKHYFAVMEKMNNQFQNAVVKNMAHSMPLFQAAGLFNPKRYTYLCSREDFLVKDFVESLAAIKKLKALTQRLIWLQST